jgi:hypothetical protein
MEKELIILAKSAKHDNYCIAGIDVETGEWVRPVSDNQQNEGAVSRGDIMLEDGAELKLLDRVKIEFIEHVPSISQPENYLYDNTQVWKKVGDNTLDEVIRLRGYDNPEYVFYNTRRDVDEDEIGAETSLLLLEISEARLFNDGYKKKLNFNYGRRHYTYFSVSDPELFSVKNTTLPAELSAVFSLTDRFEPTGKYYKMVAHVFH